MPVRLLASILAALLLLAAAGCNGSREMDQLAFVIAVGLDVGRGSALEVSFLIANPLAMGGESGGGGGAPSGGEPGLVTGVEAPSVEQAVDLINTSVTRRVTLEQMKAVFISEELARRGIRPVFDEIRRDPGFRDTAFVYINRGRTIDVLKKNKPSMEAVLAKPFELMMSNSGATGYFPGILLRNFTNALESHGEGAIAPAVAVNPAVKEGPGGQGGGSGGGKDYQAGKVPRVGGNPMEAMGTAVFRDDKLVGFLDGEATRMLLLLRGDYDRAVFTLPDPRVSGGEIVLEVRQREKPSVTVTQEGQGFLVRERILLEYDVRGAPSGQTLECPSTMAAIDSLLAGFVQTEATAVVNLAQRRYQSDILRWGLAAAHTVPTWQEWEALDWAAHFPGVELQLTVAAAMRRPGMLFNPGREAANGCLF